MTNVMQINDVIQILPVPVWGTVFPRNQSPDMPVPLREIKGLKLDPQAKFTEIGQSSTYFVSLEQPEQFSLQPMFSFGLKALSPNQLRAIMGMTITETGDIGIRHVFEERGSVGALPTPTYALAKATAPIPLTMVVLMYVGGSYPYSMKLLKKVAVTPISEESYTISGHTLTFADADAEKYLIVSYGYYVTSDSMLFEFKVNDIVPDLQGIIYARAKNLISGRYGQATFKMDWMKTNKIPAIEIPEAGGMTPQPQDYYLFPDRLNPLSPHSYCKLYFTLDAA